jgi:hypothetical protein
MKSICLLVCGYLIFVSLLIGVAFGQNKIINALAFSSGIYLNLFLQAGYKTIRRL